MHHRVMINLNDANERMVMTLNGKIVGANGCPVIMAQWLEHWQLK